MKDIDISFGLTETQFTAKNNANSNTNKLEDVNWQFLDFKKSKVINILITVNKLYKETCTFYPNIIDTGAKLVLGLGYTVYYKEYK